MSPPNADFAPLRLATKHLPQRVRVEQWHDVVGRRLLRLDSEPLRHSDIEFDADITLRALPGLRMATGSLGGSTDRRTRELTQDGNDDVVLLVNLSGPLAISQRRIDCVAKAGDAVLLTCAEPASFTRPLPGRILALFLARTRLAPLVDHLDDAHGPIPATGRDAMRLLCGYMQALNEVPCGVEAELGQAIVHHVLDLVALALGAGKARATDTRPDGANDSWLRILKADIVCNAGSPRLSVGSLAARHGLSERQIQRLFERDGKTFSEFLLEERLARAHRALCNPGSVEMKISDIAFACGFGDLSYFNRTFRARFAGTPTAIRAQAGSKPIS